MQEISQHWQTWLADWMVLGNAWLICLVAASSSFSQGEKWSISGILLLGPFGPLIYLGSYLWVLVKRKLRK